MRTLALILTLFTLPALADIDCTLPEPKPVACRNSHDRNPEPADNIRYEWTADNVTPFICGQRAPAAAYRPGRPANPAPIWFNPYAFSGQCFPTAGQTRVYRVRACWVSTGICSLNWSAPVTVIGVPADEIRCCTATECGGCS